MWVRFRAHKMMPPVAPQLCPYFCHLEGVSASLCLSFPMGNPSERTFLPESAPRADGRVTVPYLVSERAGGALWGAPRRGAPQETAPASKGRLSRHTRGTESSVCRMPQPCWLHLQGDLEVCGLQIPYVSPPSHVSVWARECFYTGLCQPPVCEAHCYSAWPHGRPVEPSCWPCLESADGLFAGARLGKTRAVGVALSRVLMVLSQDGKCPCLSSLALRCLIYPGGISPCPGTQACVCHLWVQGGTACVSVVVSVRDSLVGNPMPAEPECMVRVVPCLRGPWALWNWGIGAEWKVICCFAERFFPVCQMKKPHASLCCGHGWAGRVEGIGGCPSTVLWLQICGGRWWHPGRCHGDRL